MKHLLLAAIFVVLPCAGFAVASTPEYSIQAIRYASAEDDVADLVMGAPHEKMNLAMVVWLIRGGGRNILSTAATTEIRFSKNSLPPNTFAPTKP